MTVGLVLLKSQVLPPAFVVAGLLAFAFALLAIALEDRRGRARRIAAAVVLALVLSGTVIRAEEEDDPDFIIRNRCAQLTSADWEWWVRGCYMLP